MLRKFFFQFIPPLLYLLLIFNRQADADHLTLYAYPTPIGSNWKSPQAITRTTVLNYLTQKPRMIGHVSIEAECTTSDSNESKQSFFTGMTTEESFTPYLLKKKYGLGILFANFSGHLEKESDLRQELPDRYQNGKIAFIQFLISHTTCARITQYLNEYKQHGFEQNYGLPNRPRFGEGAGCSAFATSFLDVAGILDIEFKEHWSYTKRVPTKFIGGPLTGNRVSLARLLAPRLHPRWASENENHLPITFWDPDLMFHWIQKKWRYEQKNPTQNYQLLMRGKARGLLVDRSNVPTPNDSLWKTDSESL